MKDLCECGHDMELQVKPDINNAGLFNRYWQCPVCGETTEVKPPECTICKKVLSNEKSITYVADILAKYRSWSSLAIKTIYGDMLPYCKECYDNYKK